jgi:hypothetical protein
MAISFEMGCFDWPISKNKLKLETLFKMAISM